MPNHIHLILIVESKNIDNENAKNIDNENAENIDNGTPRAASPTKALIPNIINMSRPEIGLH